ncbi:3-hydroxyacyl-CoA dehydrogenase family protein [Nesterenkonia sp. E16_7]|uniref:3-hydroxyacyl-CoA dehydrogenase family protein n=2 Tax=unclassified Nesterenkonia TaxID=2629769 RepID=UPI001A9259C6|nr:3-hydroxyacyl-CoA dehydrogenase family protein [Nesterenkonia sp. E16_7]MBO0595581.1 3-hydroxyacyl-CoA dehydrogenase family protein [Nesterenkonia sp. E16_10]MBO0598258.1 3-hydroxyacyl-CoA dehydrogenase family protein [Nesterenkonia sp. E16_7]
MDVVMPSVVGVLGGGRMGAGIAHSFLLAGARVRIVERDLESARAAKERVERDISRSIERGSVEEGFKELAGRLTTSVDPAEFSQAELVVEAVPESWALKVAALQDVERHASPTAWLATNTSSLSVDDLAGQLSNPERFCGLHFFNPVPASKLVEVVLSKHTRQELRELSVGWVEGLGKTPVVVHDSPGFASSRLGLVIALEAIRMVEEGVASPESIDDAMVLGYKFPIGPLALTDVVGLDVRLGIAEYLESKLGDRFTPPPLMRAMVARNELGRKTGRGFYSYGD